jgi:hypothetical protein
MSYQVTVETVDGETTVTGTSGTVPAKIQINGHVAEPGTAPPYLQVNDGVLIAQATKVTA